jgi:hypothetical protein
MALLFSPSSVKFLNRSHKLTVLSAHLKREAEWCSEKWYSHTILQKASISTSRDVETWKRGRILFQLRNCQHISREASAYTVPAEKLSTYSPGRWVRILFQLRNCQHISPGGGCVYCSSLETVKIFPREVGAYTVPAYKLSTYSPGRRVRILFQLRNSQHISLGGGCVYCWSLETVNIFPGRRVRIMFQLRNCQHTTPGAGCVYCSSWETVDTFPREVGAYIVPAEKISTYSPGRRVRIRFQLKKCQHIPPGGGCVYCSSWETVNIFPREVGVYTVPAEKLSTYSPWSRVRILLQLRNWQHIPPKGGCVYYSSWESVNIFPREAGAYTVPALKMSTYSPERRVRIILQLRNCQHIPPGGGCVYFSNWETVNIFPREAGVYTVTAEKLSTYSRGRWVRIRCQLTNCQHIPPGGGCVYCSSWETANILAREAGAYTVEAEKLST